MVVGVDKFSQHVFASVVGDPFPGVGPGKIMPYHLFQGTVKPLHHSGFDVPVIRVELAEPVPAGQLFHVSVKELFTLVSLQVKFRCLLLSANISSKA